MTAEPASREAVRLGVADHLGWAVVVAVRDAHDVVGRRRIELVEPGVSPAPIHYDSARLDVDETLRLVATVRASVARATAAALDELERSMPGPIASMAIRLIPDGFPTDMAVLRRAPYEARADAVMYREILAADARRRGWEVVCYDAKTVIDEAIEVLGADGDEVLRSPRWALGPPWTKDHRTALAATLVHR